MNRDDVGVIQRGGGAGLARELLGGFRRIEIAREHLDGDHPAEHGIVRDIHGAHPTAAQSTLDLVPADSVTWLQHFAALLVDGRRPLATGPRQRDDNYTVCPAGIPPACRYSHAAWQAGWTLGTRASATSHI